LELRLSPAIQESLRCPVCKGKLQRVDAKFHCRNADCDASFPIVDGIPVLINEKSSIFSVDDFVHHRKTTLDLETGAVRGIVKRIVPSSGIDIKAESNFNKFARLLLRQSNAPKVLVIGGGILGKGLGILLSRPTIELVESDVSLGPRTSLICDAHDIPFADEIFDGAIAQAVLEHVADPYRCVDEIYRVLKKDGLVYAETAFMQQVHGGRYDFARFTHLGHRRLFRRFEELESGVACGPGMALAWSYEYFLLSFADRSLLRDVVAILGRMCSFFLKYFDYYLIDRPGALDAASGYYLLGRKGDRVLPDRELVNLYKGACRD
jgi:SAM-dependent methyltransferase